MPTRCSLLGPCASRFAAQRIAGLTLSVISARIGLYRQVCLLIVMVCCVERGERQRRKNHNRDSRPYVIAAGDLADEFVEWIGYVFEQADHACTVCEDV